MRKSTLALLGGKPIRSTPFPRWPLFGKEERAALLRVLSSGTWGIGGFHIQEFQERFAKVHGTQYGIAAMNGTVSLEIALKAGRVGEGDEVIIPPYTFVATATAVLSVNAIPVFADIDPNNYCIHPDKIREAITPRTKAIIPVHLAGHPAEMDAIMDIAKEHKLIVIEDAAHAHFAEWRERKVGSLGHMASFSFQSSKNMTAGEGGIIITNDAELAERCWSYHNSGRTRNGEWYHHPYLGGNCRMTEFQASLLLAQLPRAQRRSDLRQRNAQYLAAKLSQLPGIAPLKLDPRVTRHGYHLFVLKYDVGRLSGVPRSIFLSALAAEGIPASRGYVPLYKEEFLTEAKAFTLKTPEFLDRDYSETFCPETEKASEEAMWLPQNLLLGSRKDMDDVVGAFQKVIENSEKLLSLRTDARAHERAVLLTAK